MLGEVNDILNFKNKFQNHLDDNLDLTKKMNNLETIMDKTELEIVTLKNIMINFKNVENLEFHKFGGHPRCDPSETEEVHASG